MRQPCYGKLARLAVLLGAALALTAGLAAATPNPNSAAIYARVFNDDPFSTLTISNMYPTNIAIDDLAFPGATGFANLHVWRLSEDGTNYVEFQNDNNFRICASLVLSGNGECEGGLSLAPWWSPLVDGRFNVRTTDGEIACFGGRLPFFSFSNPPFNQRYVKGTKIDLEMIYRANGLSMTNPATIEYRLGYNGISFSSGPLNFDEGNTAEDPPHGLWGCLTPAAVGGYLQYFVGASGGGNAHAEWSEICYENLDVIPVEETTWGRIKSQYR